MSEATFAAALMSPDLSVPKGLLQPAGQPAVQRFAVYRNNVTLSLTEVLEAAFPAVRKLVGAACFAATARHFLREHPPRTRIMMLYGAEFADFLAGIAALADYPYLADVARLEHALRESYHAADAEALAVATLAGVSEADLLDANLRLAPAVRLICSSWPIHALWHANVKDGPPPQARAENVLILRPEFDPVLHAIPQAAADFMASLLAGNKVAAALAAAGNGLDLPATLTLLITGNAITGLAQ